MARYDYKCTSCGNVFEVEHPMSETPEVVCPNCGCTVQEPINQQEDKPSTGLNVLAFLFPLIGLIMYLSFKKTTPVRAKALEKWTLIGFIVGLVISAVSRAL